MVLIRFIEPEAKRRALAYLAGRFSFKSWAGGEMSIPDAALGEMAKEGIQFVVQGPEPYGQRIHKDEPRS